MSRVSRFLLLLSALVFPELVLVRAEDTADKAEKPELQYIRVTRNERRLAEAMQTSWCIVVVRYMWHIAYGL